MTYRVGIVGSGFGGAMHAPAFALHPAFEVLAIASPNSAAAIAQARNIPHAFDSLETMLAQLGDQLDVIAVTSPPATHEAAVLTALAAKKHVLCEKPFALNLAQAERMAAAGRAAGVATALSFEFRYGSATQALREMVANNHLPLLREIEVIRFGTELRNANKRPQSSWWYDKSKGGGLGNAFMPHIVDLALFVTGRTAQQAMGFLRTANPDRVDPNGVAYTSDAADGCFAVADLGEGIAARMTVDGTIGIEQATIALHAEERSAIASGVSLPDMSLFIVENGETNEYELKPNPWAKYANVHRSFPLFMRLLDDFATLIETGTGPCPTFTDGLNAQRVLEAIGYSA